MKLFCARTNTLTVHLLMTWLCAADTRASVYDAQSQHVKWVMRHAAAAAGNAAVKRAIYRHHRKRLVNVQDAGSAMTTHRRVFSL